MKNVNQREVTFSYTEANSVEFDSAINLICEAIYSVINQQNDTDKNVA